MKQDNLCISLLSSFNVGLSVLLLDTLDEPTATVCFISLTANLPSGGNSEKASTTIGFDGVILTIAASPDLIDLGNSSVTLPVLLSILFSISVNLQAIWQVWQSRTGA